ncbi:MULTISPECIES: ABC transporter ATP-binding protein [Pseudonocardia]|uniref:Trehalose import ATP-binding protein SugC n=2 Tax=Pseudonocardia TaxID=1847 RepID=A0A1Y2MYX2_PSEAH|nr:MULTISPECIES: sn-glycerol-3-phosphate ABC transporter ATP-binding protein UgpC [Pseudonocardia]OSY40382.1 Trehalose import ATP-binding protein SugC [Pseudonocardia autotrophica]TDN72287.1 carbohydrate ABC transporter ATP-binding protein (CUT1 family) [Pseudonocardia autotrophica]BBG02999.1 sugar ABC transporter ATP-binding protein [Pseudonocardia autotrophica]GEC25099.1 sugar ABC transporter ATP-binding protein [Pseudonocardia saturnea]
MASVSYDNATRLYPGSDTPAVDGLDLEIADGEFLVLVGPSGCGKSTSLRMLAGLEDVDDGAIRIGDRDVTDVRPKDRDIAMVFQNYALYPHMTVAANMGFALTNAGRPRDEIARRVGEAAKILDLSALLDRKPRALSGGQRQRVAMGRAIVREPAVFCMDEPLSNLDAKLRVSTRTQIAGLQRRLGVTTVYVTHDQVEAMTMGDRVAVLDRGVLQQCATPRELYTRPVNAFVAGFVGSPAMNLVTVPVAGDSIPLGGVSIPLPRASLSGTARSGSVTVGIRPEDLRPAGAGVDGLEVVVDVVEELGADAYVYGTLRGSPGAVTADGTTLIARVDARTPPERGATLRLVPDPERTHLFDGTTGTRLA